jgi:hypothetical protein
MKRLYIIHESAWESPVQFDHSSGPLWSSFEGKGCCWWDLGKGFRIVAGDFKAEDRESAWNSHEAVVHLHHPVKEKTLPLGMLLTPDHAHKRFSAPHMELLRSALGASDSDTLDSLNQKLAAVHPGCAIYPIPKQNPRWIY